MGPAYEQPRSSCILFPPPDCTSPVSCPPLPADQAHHAAAQAEHHAPRLPGQHGGVCGRGAAPAARRWRGPGPCSHQGGVLCRGLSDGVYPHLQQLPPCFGGRGSCNSRPLCSVPTCLPGLQRAPLRKGKLLQAAPGAKRTGSGASAAAAVAAAAAAPRDPGMVLPLPSGTALVASDSADSGGAGAAPASSASGPSAQPDLLGDAAVESREAGSAASEAAAPPKPAPSPLDLLSDLDFSWAPSAGAAPAPAAPASTNPFADLPAAPTAAPAAPAQQQPATGSSNPFGEPSPASAAPSASGFGGPAGLEWPAAALPAAPPQLQQPSWPMQQAQQQPAYGAYGGGYGGGYGAPLPSPAGGAAPHLAVSSDDPFAGFGAPSPAAAAAPRPAAGGYWGAPSPGAAAAPYGAGRLSVVQPCCYTPGRQWRAPELLAARLRKAAPPQLIAAPLPTALRCSAVAAAPHRR